MPTVIESIQARKIYNSRGFQTIEVDVYTKHSFGRVEAPSGESTGFHEVVSYPDGGIAEAIELVNNEVAPKLVGLNVEKQEYIDKLLREIDGTEDFKRIGGNVAIAVSIAVGKAAASSINMPFFQYLAKKKPVLLPRPLGNVLGGGKHEGGKAPDIQEFLVLPLGSSSFLEAAWTNIRVHERVRELLEKTDNGFIGGKGIEGAWVSNLDNTSALDLVVRATEDVSQELGSDIKVGLDIASSTLWDEKIKSYVYHRDGVERSSGEQIDYILNLIRTYKLAYVEDPLHEEDFKSFSELTKKSKSCLICGDDLFTTNPQRLKKGIKLKAGNAIIIKPNQIGTLTETIETVKLANSALYVPIASHRSSETCDTFLAHLAVGLNCPIIKVGVVGGERIAKVNEVLRIERFLGERAKLAELKI